LDEAAAKAGAGLRIWLDRTEALPHIRALLDREGKGKGRVTLVPKPGWSAAWMWCCQVRSTSRRV